MILTLVSQNLQHGAKARSNGNSRGSLAHDRRTSLDPLTRPQISSCSRRRMVGATTGPAFSSGPATTLTLTRRPSLLVRVAGQPSSCIAESGSVVSKRGVVEYADHTTHGFAMSAFDVGAADLLTNYSGSPVFLLGLEGGRRSPGSCQPGLSEWPTRHPGR